MPHLSELVKLHSDQPFAVIGVNTNDSPKAYRAGLEKFNVTWISAYQGEQGSPIADLFRVSGYPTYFLLDHKGRIVEKGHSSKALEGKIPGLIKAAKEDKRGALK